jgi:integrase
LARLDVDWPVDLIHHVQEGWCEVFDVVERDIGSIRLPQWGRVVPAEGAAPWLVVDPDGVPVEPVRRFLVEFVARDNRVGSVRSYAYGLLRWWRWLRAVEVVWDQATSTEVRDLVLWLKQASKPRRSARTASAATAGMVNPVTRKRYLDDRYKPTTVQHSNAVLRTFYEFWIELGEGPLINPVQLDRRGRRHAHHNPLEPFRAQGKVRYNPKIPRRRPREVPDERWDKLFAGLRSNRDRAILALGVSNGARAAEILGLRGVDLDWGDQLVRVFRKGTGAEQWLPASPEAFVWIRLYLAELGGPLEPNEPLWRRSCRHLTGARHASPRPSGRAHGRETKRRGGIHRRAQSSRVVMLSPSRGDPRQVEQGLGLVSAKSYRSWSGPILQNQLTA